MIYELINPSDHYTFEAHSREVATVATLLLGNGQYGAKEIGSDWTVPFMMFGGHNEWCLAQFGKDTDALVGGAMKDSDSLVACLRSFVIGRRDDYLAAISAIMDPVKRAEFAAAWHDRNRSSMNDIGGSANRLADKLSESKRAA